MQDTFFNFKGRRIEFVLPGEMDFGELRELKRISGGMGAAEVEERMKVADPDAWLAVFAVSAKRTLAETSEEDFLHENMIALMDEVNAAVAEAAEAKKNADSANPPQGAPAA